MRLWIFNVPRGIVVLVAIVLLLLVLLSVFGCSARVGPHESGWLSWDVCGYEGGVAVEITIMQAGARLGCTNPDEPETVDDPPEPEATP